MTTKQKKKKTPYKYIVTNYTVKGGCNEESGTKFNEGVLQGADTEEELEQFIWNEVKRLADDDYEQYIGVNDEEEFGGISQVFKDDDDNDITVAQFKKREGIEKLKLMSYRVHPWNSMSDVEVFEIIPNPAYKAATECDENIAKIDELLEKVRTSMNDPWKAYSFTCDLASFAKDLAKQLADRK